jgi:hypothetical protein
VEGQGLKNDTHEDKTIRTGRAIARSFFGNCLPDKPLHRTWNIGGFVKDASAQKQRYRLEIYELF